MFTMIRGAEVYAPEKLGRRDILLSFDKIVFLRENSTFRTRGMREIDGTGMLAVPGFLDQHVHVTGGGGEDSFRSRIREISLEQLVRGGVTTVVGLLGTDGTTRSVENLVAKTKALNEEGVTAFCLTGSYAYPSPTLTGSVEKDIVFIQEILGLKLAISDHRGSHMTEQELIRAASEVRRAALLSGKPGLVCLHTGPGKDGLKKLLHIVQTSDLPVELLRPTHVARVLDDAVEYAKLGGWIDFTAGQNSRRTAEALRKALEGAPIERMTLSSDGNGSSPRWGSDGKPAGMGVGQVTSLWKTVRALTEQEVLPLEQALRLITENPARALGLYPRKGCLKSGADADLLLIRDGQIDTVIAKGEVMMQGGQLLRHGYYQYDE